MFQCPDCGGVEFLEGPSGGSSINFACANCWSRFNDCIGSIQREGQVEGSTKRIFRGKFIPWGKLEDEAKAGD